MPDVTARPIVIFGAGGFAREVRWLIEDLVRAGARWQFAGYVVRDLASVGEHDCRTELVAEESWLSSPPPGAAAALGVGTPTARMKLGQIIASRLGDGALPALVHPSVQMQRGSCRVDPGVTICAGTIATVAAHFHRYCMVNLSCTVGHEAEIGAGSCLNPTVNISGGVRLGRSVLVGTGAQILQYVQVGDGAIVGAGAVVVKDVPAGETVVGIPARALRRNQ